MMFNRQMSLWMGDLDPYMEEDFIKQAFSAMGESPTGVKIITHKITGGSAGYCFVELADEASVERCVQRLNGKLVPGSNPPRKFKLNYATYGKRPEAGPEFSVFVGDLASDVQDFQLQQVFKNYPSCKGAKVVTDQYGYSRGYGFVKFGEESEQKKAIEECQGTMLSGKPLRLSVAVAKSQKISSYQGGQGQNYSSYNQSQSNYYGSNNSVAQGGYYSQWGGYDQYSGYNSSYNNTYNTGYNTGYNSGYNYNYGYGYPPPGHMPPPPIGMPPTSTDMSGAVEQNHEETGAVEEETADESIPECDVEQWNKDYMERSEEFYDALMNSHWEPLDTVDAPIPSMS
ncbi:tRNA selenocysteine 1-associated protein 1-like isoform X1 [Takifugu rubripes]|uniref:tRNA selenocysteine-associated protein 1 n=1 Tax=Takifugu rubripes TaxID=31033 RepID=A0A3B5K4G4_TAKRU|nr:tRNA selenocysteine 1-associated protein 1-like isoform X1 [Takifugu rubripes]|eukprot:XP_003975598.2 PREDICTED: tRNA selenocysteine 1-associated protein 1-like isoform X1 [Takifugu rubripes]